MVKRRNTDIKRKNPAVLRQILSYPDWEYFKYIVADASKKSTMKGTLVKDIVKQYYDTKYSKKEKEDLTKLYDKVIAGDKVLNYWEERDRLDELEEKGLKEKDKKYND